MARLTRRAENDETKAVYLYENTIDDTNCFLEGEYGYKAFEKLAAYEDIIDEPEKLKLIDELYLERCEEINKLKAELAEARNKAIDEFANWLYEKHKIDLTEYIEWYKEEAEQALERMKEV